jgi:hypothetical protein
MKNYHEIPFVFPELIFRFPATPSSKLPEKNLFAYSIHIIHLTLAKKPQKNPPPSQKRKTYEEEICCVKNK